MTPFQSALLAIEIAVDALAESGTESAREALDQIGCLGFDIRPTEARKARELGGCRGRIETAKVIRCMTEFPGLSHLHLGAVPMSNEGTDTYLAFRNAILNNVKRINNAWIA